MSHYNMGIRPHGKPKTRMTQAEIAARQRDRDKAAASVPHAEINEPFRAWLSTEEGRMVSFETNPLRKLEIVFNAGARSASQSVSEPVAPDGLIEADVLPQYSKNEVRALVGAARRFLKAITYPEQEAGIVAMDAAMAPFIDLTT